MTLVYVLAWAVEFSRLQGGAFLFLGLLTALAYGAGQIYEWWFRGHLGLSADPSALTTAIATAALVALGKMPGGAPVFLFFPARCWSGY